MFTKKFIDKVGCSISIFGNGSIWPCSQSVSPIETCEHPATVAISP